jgi:heme-binding NEAT domain protein
MESGSDDGGNNLADGSYTINVAAWHATNDAASMMGPLLSPEAKLTVVNGQITATVKFVPAKLMGTIPVDGSAITKVWAETDGVLTADSATNATVIIDEAEKTATFTFPLRALDYPKFSMLYNGNVSTARLKFNLESLTPVTQEQADKTVLADSLMAAKAVTQGKKTDFAWQGLQTAIADAQAVFDEANATQEQTDNAKNALAAAVDEFKVSADKTEGLDKNDLADGVYTLNADMVQINRSSLSMSNNAIDHTVTLNVIGGKYYIAVDFKGLTVGNDLGYLSRLKYYGEGYTFGQYGAPQGTLIPSAVLSWQTDSKGAYIVDIYNDNANPYPKRLQFPLVNKANYEGDFVPLQVFVPIMDAITAGSGTQDVLMRLDWTSLIAKTDGGDNEDPGNGGGNGGEEDENGGNGGGEEQNQPVKTELAAKLASAKVITQGNYTDVSYQILQSTIKVAQGVYDSKYATQTEVNEQIKALTNAVNGLTLRPEEVVNKYGLKDGKYEARVDLWHATQDKASMGNGSLNHTALIEVSGDKLYMSVSMHPMQVGTITASLASLQIQQAGGGYVYADVIARNIEGGKPSAFRFALPSKDTYIPVKVDPQVSVMGDEPVDARLRISWDTLTKVSADTAVSSNTVLEAASVDAVVSSGQNLSDPGSGIKVEAGKNVLPDGTTLKVAPITSGADYDKAETTLDGVVKAFVLYDLSLLGPSGSTIQPNGKVKVSIPIPAGMSAANLLIYRINPDGSKTLMQGTAENGFAVFTTTQFGLYAIGEKADAIAAKANTAVKAAEADNTPSAAIRDVSAPLAAPAPEGISLLWLLIPIAGAAIAAAALIIHRKLRLQDATAESANPFTQ